LSNLVLRQSNSALRVRRQRSGETSSSPEATKPLIPLLEFALIPGEYPDSA